MKVIARWFLLIYTKIIHITLVLYNHRLGHNAYLCYFIKYVYYIIFIQDLNFIVIKGLIQMSNCLQCYACQSCNDPFNIYNAPILKLLDGQGFNCTVNRKRLFFNAR